MYKAGTFTLVALAATALSVGTASAHTGNIQASENCESWSVAVSLDHNVTHDRTVSVTTSIPGTVGIDQAHFDTSFGEIWSASGQSPTTGTVTLTIDAGTRQEFTTSASIHPQEGCEQPTTSTSTTSTTNTTEAPTSTTTIPEATTTLPTSSSTSIPTSTTSSTMIQLLPPIQEQQARGIPQTQRQLPRTGSSTAPLAMVGVALLVGGALMVGRKKERA